MRAIQMRAKMFTELRNIMMTYSFILILSFPENPILALAVNGEEKPKSALMLEEYVIGNKLRCTPNEEAEVGVCLEPILQYANRIHDQSGTETSKHFLTFHHKSSNIIHKLCSLYASFNTCAKSVDCASISRRAVVASYGYMCGPGFDLFEKHADCFAEVENHSGYLKCKMNANGAFEKATLIAKNVADVNENLRELCMIMNNYLTCCKPFVYNRCGLEAWRLVSKITVDSLKVFCPSHQIQGIN